MSHRNLIAFGTVALVAVATSILPPSSQALAQASTPKSATFDGRLIDLSKGWGEAAACNTDGRSTRCFRTEAEMDQSLAEEHSKTSPSPADSTLLAACSTGLRLYDGSSFTGTVLTVSTSGVWVNLSTYGFDNRTTSYRVGACDSYFAESTGGGGAWYPGNTAAWAQASSMAAGWNDRVSSVYQ